METTAKFSLNEAGADTGRVYSGTFTVKTLLTRNDQFIADQRRREILGPGGHEALESLKSEAFMHGQNFVRILEAPAFWKDSRGGLDLEDFNIVQAVFDKCIALANERSAALQKEAAAALKKMASKESKEQGG